MTYIKFGFGAEKIGVEIPAENLIASLMPRKEENIPNGEAVVKAALAHPIGTETLDKIAKPNEKVAIIISDVTRPCPSYKLLPQVIQELNAVGVKDGDITIVCGLGSHRQQTATEWEKLVGTAIYQRIKVEDSTAHGFITLGKSTKGTPFEVAKTVVDADIRICLGNIDYHYFAGYSGGAKAIVPGVCTRATIEANHTMMLEEMAKVGCIEGNPVREDMEEILNFLSIDFILNVVLNEKKEIVGAVAGDAIGAHRAGCKILDRIYKQYIDELADIVIASPGGLPKDLNVYQTQKALDNAQWAVKKDGIIILVGQCKEGYGEATFEAWLNEANSPDDLLNRIGREFKLGGHKAAAIAAVTKKAHVYLVSALAKEKVDKLYMTAFQDLETAFTAALNAKGSKATVYAMTVGGTTLPVYQGAENGKL
ncbi:MAG: nickel-dependent lactate racemase [Clostridiales bacterium]